jgi:hypothetical protein
MRDRPARARPGASGETAGASRQAEVVRPSSAADPKTFVVADPHDASNLTQETLQPAALRAPHSTIQGDKTRSAESTGREIGRSAAAGGKAEIE